MQNRVHEEVELAKRRSGWPARKALAALGIARRSYYRWLREEAWAKSLPPEPVRPVSPYEALSEEKAAVLAFARTHPQRRHRELAWRMVDEDVALLRPSTVSRILKEADLVCPWRRRAKRKKVPGEKATRPDQRWSTDRMHLQVGERAYDFICFLDDSSRSLVPWEVLLGMDGLTVRLAAPAAIDRLPNGPDGAPRAGPEIRSENGSGYISKEFGVVLQEDGLSHHRIPPPCPEENGRVERASRTFREGLEGEEPSNLLGAQEVRGRVVRWYNEERLPRALGYLPPAESDRGDPPKRFEERRVKLVQARDRRRERNLQLQQGT